MGMEPGMTDEDRRFASRPPVITVLSLSSCSLLYMMAQNVQDALDLFYVGKRFGDNGVSTVGLGGLLKFLSLCCTNIVSTGTILKTSSLIALKRQDVAAQVIADLIRFAFIVGLVLPVPLYFLAPSILRFADCPADLLDDAQSYILPIFSTLFFSMLYQICCAQFMGEGRALSYAICQLAGFVLNVLVFDPLFILALKLPIWSVGLSFSLSQMIPGIVLFFIIFKGKLGIKPTWAHLCRKPVRDSPHALFLALPSFLTVLVGAIPPVFLTRCLLAAAANEGGEAEKKDVSSVFSASLKVYNIVGAWTIGTMDGMLPCASYAYAAKNFKRVIQLFFAAYSLPFLAHVIVDPMMIVDSSLLLRIWVSKDLWACANKVIPPMYYTYIVQPIFQGCMDLLVSTGRSLIALIPQIIRGVGIVAASYALYYTSNQKDPKRIMFVWVVTDVAVVVSATLLASIPFRELAKGKKGEESALSTTGTEGETLLYTDSKI